MLAWAERAKGSPAGSQAAAGLLSAARVPPASRGLRAAGGEDVVLRISAVLRFAVELLPCLLLGLGLGRWRPGLPARLAPPQVHWGVPISMGGLLLIRLLPPLRQRLGAGTLQLGSVMGNTAYWGLPAALALLPPAALTHTISYDLVGTLVTWSVGPLLAEGTPARPRPLLALLVQLTPWHQSLAALLWWPARAVLLVALTLVGMRLGVLLSAGQVGRAGSSSSDGLVLAMACKLLLLPALLLLVTALLPLPELVGDAVVLQAAAPTAISVLLIGEAAEARGRRGEAAPAAALVLWSTLAALVTVPLWGLLLARLPPG